MVEYLPNWYKIDQLIELVQFVGVKRPDYQLDTSYPVILLDTPGSRYLFDDDSRAIKTESICQVFNS